MDELYISSCAQRRVYGRTSPMLPSLFLREADKKSLRIIGTAPAGFGNAGRQGYGQPGAKPPGAKVSSDGRWSLGCRIFHDDHGYGAIIGIDEGEDGPVVKVRFDNGYETRFLSGSQSSNFTKIGNDDD